ncbi:MAG: hypothetical protein ABR886_01100 [Dehalococcoidales bacterium]
MLKPLKVSKLNIKTAEGGERGEQKQSYEQLTRLIKISMDVEQRRTRRTIPKLKKMGG